MVTNLYFVRHAHSAYTPDEAGRALSDKGKMDAERITALLRDEDIDYVLASPYKRALQTVQVIADFIGTEVILDEGFKERTLADGAVENFNEAITKLWQEPSFSYGGGESNLDAQKRGMNAMVHVLKKYAGKNIVIGTHGNIMALIMNHYSPQYDYAFWRDLTMPDIYKLTFGGLNLKEVQRMDSL